MLRTARRDRSSYCAAHNEAAVMLPRFVLLHTEGWHPSGDLHIENANGCGKGSDVAIGLP